MNPAHFPLFPWITYLLLTLGLLSLSRLLLILWQFKRVGDWHRAGKVLLYGLRFDLVLLSYLWLFPAFLLLWLPETGWLNQLITLFCEGWFFITTLFLLSMVAGRSSFQHRPANSSIAAFTNDQLANKLGLSSTYTVLEALVGLRNESSEHIILSHPRYLLPPRRPEPSRPLRVYLPMPARSPANWGSTCPACPREQTESSRVLRWSPRY